jgi:hypothetical protein
VPAPGRQTSAEAAEATQEEIASEANRLWASTLALFGRARTEGGAAGGSGREAVRVEVKLLSEGMRGLERLRSLEGRLTPRRPDRLAQVDAKLKAHSARLVELTQLHGAPPDGTAGDGDDGGNSGNEGAPVAVRLGPVPVAAPAAVHASHTVASANADSEEELDAQVEEAEEALRAMLAEGRKSAQVSFCSERQEI